MKNITHINGKKLKKSHINVLVKLANVYGVALPAQKETRQNPYSGIKHELEPLAVALYDFVIESYNAGRVKGSSFVSPVAGDISRAFWDSCRYMFLEYWPEKYFDLID